MIELTINIKATELSQAISQLATAINGSVVSTRVEATQKTVDTMIEAEATKTSSVQETSLSSNSQMTESESVPIAIPEDNTAPVPEPEQPTAAAEKKEEATQVQADAVPAQEPMQTTAVQEPVAADTTPAVIDKDAISRAGAELIDQGKMNEVIEILQNKYGIMAVTQLKPDQYEAFAGDLRALGANI